MSNYNSINYHQKNFRGVTMKIKDRLLLASFVGGIAAIAANLFLYAINFFLPGQNINMPELTAEIFLRFDPANVPAIVRSLGFIWSMVVGGIYSFLNIMILDWTGWRLIMVKTVIVILGAWLIIAGSIIKLLSLAYYVSDEPWSIAAFFIAHLFFAFILSLLTKRFGSAAK